MSSPQKTPSQPQRQANDFTEAFAIAKEALQFVGKYKTPPTPDIYEVWYRYAEGLNDPIKEQLSHAVDEDGQITAELISSLHSQFCAEANETVQHVGNDLQGEIETLQSLIDSQLDAGNEFSNTIDSANLAFANAKDTSEEVIAQVNQLIASNAKMQSRLATMNTQLLDSKNQVSGLQSDLVDSQRSIMTDPLTGVGNRRYFNTMIDRLIKSHGKSDQEDYLLLIDLDHFKDINDSFGHSAGDQVLVFVTSEIQTLRETGSICRYGGDEFAIFIPLQNAGQATEYAEQIRRLFANTNLRFANSGEILGRIGLSIGVARLRDDDTPDTWFNRADQLLYRAKDSGRNCFFVERSLDETRSQG